MKKTAETLIKEFNDLKIRMYSLDGSFFLKAEKDYLRGNYGRETLTLNVGSLKSDTLEKVMPFITKHKALLSIHQTLKCVCLTIEVEE